MTIHVTHRFGAILTTLVVIALAFQLLSAKSKVLVRTAVWLVALLTLQLLLGISNVVFSLPLVVAVGHNLGAALLLVTVLRANYVLFDRSTSRVTHSELLDKEGVR